MSANASLLCWNVAAKRVLDVSSSASSPSRDWIDDFRSVLMSGSGLRRNLRQSVSHRDQHVTAGVVYMRPTPT